VQHQHSCRFLFVSILIYFRFSTKFDTINTVLNIERNDFVCFFVHFFSEFRVKVEVSEREETKLQTFLVQRQVQWRKIYV